VKENKEERVEKIIKESNYQLEQKSGTLVVLKEILLLLYDQSAVSR
jgi:hypothetical protein